jgi:uncharacterized protein (TIGR02246 family)
MTTTQIAENQARTEDEKAIYNLFQALLDAWNKGDGTTYGACFTENADYIVFDGSHLKGRQQIATAHQKLFDTFLKGSKLEGAVTDLRFITPEVAVFHATGAARLRWQTKAPVSRQSIQTYLAHKQAGRWQLVAFHNTRIHKPNLLFRLLVLFGRR